MAKSVRVDVVADVTQYERALRRAAQDTKQFERTVSRSAARSAKSAANWKQLSGGVARGAARGAGGGFGLPIFGGGPTVAGAVGAGAVAAGIKKSVAAASDLNEQIGKSQVVFGKSAAAVEDWSKTLVSSFALSQRQALATASSFGALFRPLGFTAQEAAKQSEKLTELGADLASFYNTSVQDALDAIQSGLVGEVEPLRRYGLVLSETRVQQEALRQTGLQHAAQLTDQEKVVARLNLIFKGSKQAQGDSARSSERFAKQTKELSANLDDLAASLGKLLLPPATNVEKKLNEQAENIDKQGTGANNTKKSVEALGNVWGHVRAPAERFGKAVWNLNYAVNVYRFDTMVLAKVQDTFFAKTMASAGAVEKLTEGLKKAGAASGKVDLRTAGGIVVPKGTTAKDINTLFGVSTEQIERRNNWFDQMISRGEMRAGLLPTLSAQIAALQVVQAKLKQRFAITNDITRQQNLEDEILQNAANIRGLVAQRSEEAQQAAEERKARVEALVQAAKDEALAWADFAIERAGATETLRDDLQAAQAKLALLQKQAGVGKKTAEQARLIWEAQQDVNNISKKMRADQDTGFRHLTSAQIRAAIGGDASAGATRRLIGLFSTLGPRGSVPRSTGQFALAGGTTIYGDVHLNGPQNMRQLTNELTKHAKGRSHVRRGARG